MFTAYDQTIGRVVDAEEAKENGGKSHVYICKNEDCGCTMILRISEEGRVQPHFAHHGVSTPAQRACVAEEREGKANDLSEWTQRWSAKFPVDVRDEFISHKGKYRKASALYKDSMTAVYIRHTRCLAKEFTSRTEHFTSEGYRTVWLIDGSEWQAKEFIRRLSWSELSEEQRRISKEKSQFHFEFSRYADFFGTYDPEMDKNTLVYVTLLSDEGKEFLYRIDWVRSDQARFSAIYTKESDFLSDCATKKPYSADELEKIRKKVQDRREQRRKQFIEELKKKGEEEPKTEEAPKEPDAPKCPKCGKPMVRKTNRRTGQEFWGCSDPACWKK